MGNKPRKGAAWIEPAAYLALFLVSVFFFPSIEELLRPLVRRKAVFVQRDPLWKLAFEHLALVVVSSGLSGTIAFGLALHLSRERYGSLRDLATSAASFLETFPSMAIIALLIPLTGYGFVPVAAALFLYGLLPVFRNTTEGLLSAPPELVDAALGAGMDEDQILWKLRLPLAKPMVVQGFRVSLIINISAATLGAVVGAGGLGIPIVSGIRAFDPILMIQGSLPVAFLALFADAALKNVEKSNFVSAG